MLVATTHFRPMAPLGLLKCRQCMMSTYFANPISPKTHLGGAGSNILCWSVGGRVEQSGMHFSSPTSCPRFSTSLCNLLHVSSISCKRGRKSRRVSLSHTTTPCETCLLSSKKQQYVSFVLLTKMNLDHCFDGRLYVIPLGLWGIKYLHRVSSARNGLRPKRKVNFDRFLGLLCFVLTSKGAPSK